jgi:hypothetical protein
MKNKVEGDPNEGGPVLASGEVGGLGRALSWLTEDGLAKARWEYTRGEGAEGPSASSEGAVETCVALMSATAELPELHQYPF